MNEIIAYARNADIIAFDEPTAPLTDAEIEILFDLILKLKAEGKVVIYVSHRLAEIFKIADDIVVLKDGRLVKLLKAGETSEAELIRAMVCRDIGDTYANLSRNESFGKVMLEVKNLQPSICAVSFRVRKAKLSVWPGLSVPGARKWPGRSCGCRYRRGNNR